MNNFNLTEEQQIILDKVVKPHEQIPISGIVSKITAGAGCGKTTTLLLLSKGYSNHFQKEDIIYLTFNKAAAADAQQRLGSFASCRTLHSMAFNVMNVLESNFKILLTDGELDKLIKQNCANEIDEYIQHSTADNKGKKYLARKMIFFIRKTLIQFMNSNYDENAGFSELTEWPSANYYPAILYHESNTIGLPNKPGSFYLNLAKKIWNQLKVTDGTKKVVTYDSVMKSAQLLDKKIPGKVLLLDESQDMNACNFSWVTSDKNKSNRQIVFVGDAVQTIYGFRGCKSKYLMNLPCTNYNLTRSFRFGPEIASVANSILFAKENSSEKDWEPYRLTGGGERGTIVPFTKIENTEEKNNHVSVYENRTILALSNLALFDKSLELLMANPGIKISINGKGSGSGMGMWKSQIKLIKKVYEIYNADEPVSVNELDGFEGVGKLSWAEFTKEVDEREMNSFVRLIKMIEKYKAETLNNCENFQSNVLSQSIEAGNADIILSTIHSAKGQEWDVVEVLNDINEKLANFRVRKTVNNKPVGQFNFQGWGDVINLFYVAVTRAKRKLILSRTISALFEEFARIYNFSKLEKKAQQRIVTMEKFCLYGTNIIQQEEVTHYGNLKSIDHISSDDQEWQLEPIICLSKTLVEKWIKEVKEKGCEELLNIYEIKKRKYTSKSNRPSTRSSNTTTSTTDSATNSASASKRTKRPKLTN